MTFTPITLYFLYFLFSRPESQLCTPQNRTDTCTEEEYSPVCALYSGDDCNSPTGFCYRTLLRTCDACLDSNILGYTPGECEEPTFPKVCEKSQRQASCANDEFSRPVCGYSKPQRLRSKAMKAEIFPSGCDACSSEQVMFHIRGECKDSSDIGVCGIQKNNKGCPFDVSSEPICAYYTGVACDEKLCRKTVNIDACNICEDSTVLFYVKGSCDYSEPGSEDVEELILDSEPEGEYPIPELEPVIQEDGTIVYEEVKPEEPEEPVEVDCIVEEQEDIPELEAVLQEDGTTVYEIATPKVLEIMLIVAPLEQIDASNLQEKTNEIIEALQRSESDIPTLQPVIQEDGTVLYEEVKPEESEESIDVDCIVEVQDDIPELEPVIQEDGTIVYEEVKPEESEEPVDVDCIVEQQDEIPELEAVLQEDGSYVYEEVQASEVPEKVESEETIEDEPSLPEPEPIVRSEELVLYEEDVKNPVNEGLDACEDGEAEVKVAQQVEMIETRLLVEPSN